MFSKVLFVFSQGCNLKKKLLHFFYASVSIVEVDVDGQQTSWL